MELIGDRPPSQRRYGETDGGGRDVLSSRAAGAVWSAGSKAHAATSLVVELLAREGAVWVREASWSMSPVIREGDEVRLLPPEPQRIRRGALIACRREEGLVLHRVLTRNQAGVITKGDALASPDRPVEWGDVVARGAALRRAGMPSADLDAFPWSLINPLLGALSALAGRLRLKENIRGMPSLLPRLAWISLRLPFHLARCLIP